MITNKGKTIKIAVNDMPIIGRNTQGVRLQVLQDDEKLVAISRETIVDDEWLKQNKRTDWQAW